MAQSNVEAMNSCELDWMFVFLPQLFICCTYKFECQAKQ